MVFFATPNGTAMHQLDIETILLSDMKIKRADYGKSLETFYNFPYYGYSDQVVLPQSLFTGLNINFLLKNHWLPIQKEDDTVTILIDNPANQDKIPPVEPGLGASPVLRTRPRLRAGVLHLFNFQQSLLSKTRSENVS